MNVLIDRDQNPSRNYLRLRETHSINLINTFLIILIINPNQTLAYQSAIYIATECHISFGIPKLSVE